MYTSIEILVPTSSSELELDTSAFSFQIKLSFPPESDRGESSLWQRDFDEIGGVLIHIGDPPDIKVKKDRFYTYNIFSNPDESHRRIRFIPNYGEDLISLLNQASKLSDNGYVYLTFDAWLGPKKRKKKKTLSEQKIRKTFENNKYIRNCTFWQYKPESQK